MPCGKRPLIKSWDRPRKLKVITPSRYEQNEASVKVHWTKVVRDLELSYKDEQFWESNSATVRQLVGPIVFKRIGKIFDLPREETHYQPADSDAPSPIPSEQFYATQTGDEGQRESFTISELSEEEEEEEEEVGEEESEKWSGSTIRKSPIQSSRFKSVGQSLNMSKTLSKMMSTAFSRIMMKSLMSTQSKDKSMRSIISEAKTWSSWLESTVTSDDLRVHMSQKQKPKRLRHRRNPHFDMLYCNESETDMIKWNSKYKQKTFEVSASDEFSKKAEILSKQIAKDFFEWWVGLGNVEFKSEIRRPEDIEDLFQIWFDEHASRGLVLHPKVLPCVLKTIADYVGEKKAACPKVLKRQIAYDIHGETTPAHLMAFGTNLPQKMKHIPPKNNTETMWQGVKIPEDLRTMSCVWGDISHLTSTKAFHQWLAHRPHLPMPPCLNILGATGDTKQKIVVPSDYVMKDTSGLSSAQELALPVSQFSIELKDVLSKILN